MIEDIRLYNRALSDYEIHWLHTGKKPNKILFWIRRKLRAIYKYLKNGINTCYIDR